jgi:hypothetical protein
MEYLCPGQSSTWTNLAGGGNRSALRSKTMSPRSSLCWSREVPRLPFPYSSAVMGSRHGHLRELRVQSGGDPLRVFYAFDPRRTAILLLGGSKAGDDRFYEHMIPRADRLYDAYLDEIRREGLIP